MPRRAILFSLFLGHLLLSCGERQSPAVSQVQVVGGKQVDDEAYKQYLSGVVSLQYQGRHHCGGILVRPNTVLTAAHCLADFDREAIEQDLTIVIGTRDIRYPSRGERFNVARYSINSRYDAESMQYDSATITLNGKSAFPPLRVNRSPAFPAPGSTVYLAGWGSGRENGSLSSVLKTASVAVVGNADCAQVYGSDINNANLCAYAAGIDSCQGDSGGPILSFDGKQMTAVGIVSWGNGCAQKGYPGVYTRTSSVSF